MNNFRWRLIVWSSLTAAMALLSGGAIALPNYSISTGTVAFGSVPLAVVTPAQISVTITNVSGGTRVNLQMAGGGLAPPPFGNSQNCQGATLAPGGTCQVIYTFSPMALGPVSVSNSFTIDGELFSVLVSGTGISGLTVTPAINFGSVPLTVTAAPQSATVTNVSGVAIGPVQMAGGGLAPPPFGNSQNCQGATLAPGGTCQVIYTFSPVALGLVSVSNTFSLNGVPFTVAVSGVGTSLQSLTKAFGAQSIGVNGSTPLSFTVQNIDNTTTVQNVSFTDVLPTGLVISTPSGLVGSCGGGTITAVAGSSTVSLSGATLAPLTSCTFSVNVTGNTPGRKDNTTGPITSTESGGGTATASLQVDAIPVPALSLWGTLLLLALMIAAGFTALRQHQERGV